MNKQRNIFMAEDLEHIQGCGRMIDEKVDQQDFGFIKETRVPSPLNTDFIISNETSNRHCRNTSDGVLRQGAFNYPPLSEK